MSDEREKPPVLQTLRVRVNPDYDWDVDPSDQHSYTNPVMVANKQVQLTNAALFVAQQATTARKALGDVRTCLQTVDNALADLERDILNQFPAPAARTASHRLLDAYINQMLQTASEELQDAFRRNRTERRRLLRRKVELEIDVENAEQTMGAIKMASENLKTFLAFAKFDAER